MSASSWDEFSTSCLPAPQTVFNSHDPYLDNRVTCVRRVRDFKEIQFQFLESTGIQTIGPFENGMELKNVTVSGPDNYKCITDTVALANLLTVGCIKKDGKIVFDSGKVNEYTNGDIAPGKRKLVSIQYMVEDVTFVESKRFSRPLYTASKMVVEKRNTQQEDGSCQIEERDGLSDSRGYSNVYAVNREEIADEYGNTYGIYEPTVEFLEKNSCKSQFSRYI